MNPRIALDDFAAGLDQLALQAFSMLRDGAHIVLHRVRLLHHPRKLVARVLQQTCALISGLLGEAGQVVLRQLLQPRDFTVAVGHQFVARAQALRCFSQLLLQRCRLDVGGTALVRPGRSHHVGHEVGGRHDADIVDLVPWNRHVAGDLRCGAIEHRHHRAGEGTHFACRKISAAADADVDMLAADRKTTGISG